jgi:hypothetical protein
MEKSHAIRSLDRARNILASEGVTDAAGLGEDGMQDGLSTEDRLGCSVVEHRTWLRTAPAAELRGWARDWAES